MNRIQPSIVCPLFLAFLLLGFSSCKKKIDIFEEGSGTVLYNSLLFDEVSTDVDISYGSSTTQGGNSQDLKLDLYEPLGSDEVARPLIILSHGGGFTGGNKEDLEELATYLARSGYVVASISYRLIDVEQTATSTIRGVMDAAQDLKGAVRFFRKDASIDQVYRIDPQKIFVGGYSAGAFMSLHLAYLNTEAELESSFGSDIVDYVNQNGGLEGNSGNEGYSSEVKGVLNIAGALIKAELVDPLDPILYSVHGTEDTVVPFMEGESDGTGVSTEGSGLIHVEADNEGISNRLKAISGGDHGVFFQCQECAKEMRQFVFDNL